jgi:hypothetical protein
MTRMLWSIALSLLLAAGAVSAEEGAPPPEQTCQPWPDCRVMKSPLNPGQGDKGSIGHKIDSFIADQLKAINKSVDTTIKAPKPPLR